MTYIRQTPYTYADDERVEAPKPTYYRATRPVQDDEIVEERSTRPGRTTAAPTQQRQQRSNRPAPETWQDDEIVEERSTRPGRALAPAQHQPRPRLHGEWHIHPLVWIGLGMLALFVLWFISVRVYAWGVNTFHNPTQTAHLDTVTVTIDAQHTDQVRAFIDSQNHIDVLVIPDSTIGKARIVQGPMAQGITDLQHAYISVTAQGTSITVTVQGPLEVQGLGISPNSMGWQTDMSSSQGRK